MSNVFDQFDSTAAVAAVPPTAPTRNPFDQFDPQEDSGFFGGLRAGFEREAASPSVASSLDLLGLEFGTMDPAKFASEQAAKQREMAAVQAGPDVDEPWTAANIGSMLGALPSQIAEAVPAMAAGAGAGGVVGAVGGPVGAAGGALAGVSAGAGLQDMSRSFISRLAQKGIDVTNEFALLEAINDEETYADAFWYAAKRAGTIGLLTGVTGKVGSVLVPKTFVPAVAGASRTLGQKTGVAAVGAGVGTVGGAVQETGAQLASTGGIEDPNAILAEALVGSIAEAPAIVAPTIGAGVGRAVRPSVAARVPPGAVAAPRQPQVVLTPEGNVSLVDSEFDLDEADPDVKETADLIREVIGWYNDPTGPASQNQGLVLPQQILDAFPEFDDSEIGRVAVRQLTRWRDSPSQKNHAVTLDRVLQWLSPGLLSARELNGPNDPQSGSMVPSLRLQRPGEEAATDVPLAEGRDIGGRSTLIVERDEALSPVEAQRVVQFAQKKGFEQVAFSPESQVGPVLAEAAGGRAAVRRIDALFGDSREMGVVAIPQEAERGPVAQSRGAAAMANPTGWGSVDDPGFPDIQIITQPLNPFARLTATPDDAAVVVNRMSKVMQDVAKAVGLSKKVALEIGGRLRDNQKGEASWWHAPDTARITINPDAHGTLADVFSTLMHELGHLVMYDKLNRADARTQLAILHEYAVWREAVDHEKRLQRQHRQIATSRETTTSMTAMFSSGFRALGLRGDPAYQAYWTSYTEWFAQQVARWATTQPRPLTIVDKFFQSLGKTLKKLLERMYRSAGLKFEPTKAVKTYMDAFLQDVVPERFGSLYEQIEQDSRLANQRALRAVGAEYVEAVPQSPTTGPSREAIRKLFSRDENGAYRRGEKKTVQELEAAAAEADRITLIHEYGARLDQLAEENKHVRGLQLYKEVKNLANLFKAKLMERAVLTTQKAQKLNSKMQQALFEALDDYGQGRFRTDDEVQRGVMRRPTEEELQTIFDQYELSEAAQTTARQMIADFDHTLTLLEEVWRAQVERSFGRDLVASAKAYEEIDASMARLRQQPYMPQLRFGRWTVTIRAKDGSVVWFSQHGNWGKDVLKFGRRERDRTAAELRQLYPPSEFDISTGVLADDVIPMMGLPKPLLEMIAARAELSPTQAEYVRQLSYEMSPVQSFKHRLQKRQNIAGYSKDYLRSYAAYFLQAANFLARAKHGDDMRAAIKTVHEQAKLLPDGEARGRIGNFMQDDFKHWMDPKPDFWRLKGAAFLWALGFNPISALVNATSTITTTYPLLAGGYGDRESMNYILRAGKSLETFARKVPLGQSDDLMMRALNEAVQTGRIDESWAVALAGTSEGRNLLQQFSPTPLARGMSWFMEKSGSMFQLAEQFNRRIGFRAGFELGRRYPTAQFTRDSIDLFPLEFERLVKEGWNPVDAGGIVVGFRTVEQSQGLYSRTARARFMRGKLGSLFLFKGFQQNLLWMLWNHPGGAMRSLLIFGLLGGLMAEPGAEDLVGLLKTIAHRAFGVDFDLERETRSAITEWSDLDPDWLLHGTASQSFGIPAMLEMLGIGGIVPKIDLSGRVSAGAISPVPLDLFVPTDDPDAAIARGVERGSGAAFGLGFAVTRAIIDSRSQGTWMKLVPAAIRGIPKAVEGFMTGQVTGPSGAAVIQFDPRDTEQMMELISLGTGANPLRLTKEWSADREVSEVLRFWDIRQQALLRQLAEAIRTGDPEEHRSVLQAIHYFNSTLPKDMSTKRITSDMARQSISARIRRQRMQEMNIPVRRADRPIADDVRKLYFPDATEATRVR